MIDERSAARRRAQWERLAALVTDASRLRGLRGLSESDLLEFGRLYRRAASDLSHARAYGLDAKELEYLNWLVGRAYGLLYVSESSGWAGVRRFFRRELPQTLRRQWRVIALAGGLFFGSAALSALFSLLRPDLLELVNPGLAASVDAIAERHRGGADFLPADFRPVASSLIMVNNVQVSFLAFSTGILLGLGTLLVLVFNGFVLGALAAGVGRTDAAVHFWAFVAPHGVIELPTIIISAAAGLLLGFAVIAPGEYSRIDALRVAGRQAGVMMLGVIAFLAVAGVVEGFFSPAVMPPVIKFAVAAILAMGFLAYVLLGGRQPENP
ncbi:MAG: stage II sporulation protein M [Armatimonadota bacterium]|nr:MAG: stage II sporulation protein M [Armatimonadota bacterium]